MEERTKIFVGLDVHKDSISVAAAESGRGGARLIGKVTHDVNKLLKVLGKIGTAEQLHIVYEAGPTRIRTATRLEGAGLRLRDHCTVADPAASGRPSQDRRA